MLELIGCIALDTEMTSGNVLDLFCGAGGASMGLHKAGFDVIGVDIAEQPEYPFDFIQSDATQYIDFDDYDLIWASPPCQAYCYGSEKAKNKHPKLIEVIRKLLLSINKPFIIENIPTAPIRKDLMLCGEMFGLKVIRHRIFEINGFFVKQPNHIKHKGTIADGFYYGVYTGGKCGCWGNNEKRKKVKVGSIKDWQTAMGINWITDKKMLAEAIPPAYSKYIGEQFKRWYHYPKV